MRYKMKTVLLTMTLILAPLGSAVRAQGWNAPQGAKVKAEVRRLVSAGNRAIDIKLLNGSEQRGQIGRTSEMAFTFTEDKTKNSFKIAYGDVREVKGQSFSRGRKLGIIAALTGGLLFAVVALSRKPHPGKHGVHH